MTNYKKARKEIADWINVDLKALCYTLYKTKTDENYKRFEIPKKSGGSRIIYAPNGKLKYIQRKIYEKIYEKVKDQKQKIFHGFLKNKSIITNAYEHRNKKYLLNVDIEDFFPSFNFGRVQGYFFKCKKFKFSLEKATVLAQLVCYQGSLPQGAPTSPIISNLIFNIVDLRILALTKKYKLTYTRYADDLSFSTNNKSFLHEYKRFLFELQHLIEKSGFKINKNKTRFIWQNSRQEVTGLTTNEKVNANKKFIKATRAMADRLFKTGNFKIGDDDGDMRRLEGRFSFINQMDFFNKIKKIVSKKGENKNLNTRERQYQRFLFYKYFYKPSLPTIVTEGKTDILHIKAALMNNYDKYPNLISKDTNGNFKFKIYFLRRTNRLEYFFKISPHGADAMTNIWNCYKEGSYQNIYDYIKAKKKPENLTDTNPVILLFDNEQSKKKPLKKFLKISKVKFEGDEIYKCLRGNLFLVKLPLPSRRKECEIENLYNKRDLDQACGGKILTDKKKYDRNKYCGKFEAALYIIKNYKSINFNNFISLLNAINIIPKIKQ